MEKSTSGHGNTTVEYFLMACSRLNLYFDGTILKPLVDQWVTPLNWQINNNAIVDAIYQWIDAEKSVFLNSKQLSYRTVKGNSKYI